MPAALPALVQATVHGTRYKRIALKFIRFLNDDSTTPEEFLQYKMHTVVPMDVYRFFCKAAYGLENPSTNDNPTSCRSSTLMFYKKAISAFVPNRNMLWNELSQQGNPTRSTLVQRLIQVIKKKEVRHQGKKSKKTRAFTKGEMDQVLNILESDNRVLWKYSLAAFVKLQIHMIGRVDDMSHVTISGIKCNEQYPFTLLAKISWSKNVNEERESVDQLVLGSSDSRYCVLIALAISLEASPQKRTEDFLFGRIGQEPNNFKSSVQAAIKWIVSDGHSTFQRSDNQLPEAERSPLGTHSIRKFAATTVRRNDGSRDDVDARGRWRRHHGVSDDYVDLYLPAQDAKVAAILSFGGPVKYVLQEAMAGLITETWLLDNVVPTINVTCGRRVALALAYPLLYAAFDQDGLQYSGRARYMPARIRSRINEAYAALTNGSVSCPQPVLKLPQQVSGAKN